MTRRLHLQVFILKSILSSTPISPKICRPGALGPLPLIMKSALNPILSSTTTTPKLCKFGAYGGTPIPLYLSFPHPESIEGPQDPYLTSRNIDPTLNTTLYTTLHYTTAIRVWSLAWDPAPLPPTTSTSLPNYFPVQIHGESGYTIHLTPVLTYVPVQIHGESGLH